MKKKIVIFLLALIPSYACTIISPFGGTHTHENHEEKVEESETSLIMFYQKN